VNALITNDLSSRAQAAAVVATFIFCGMAEKKLGQL
jgi:hypothetical protein